MVVNGVSESVCQEFVLSYLNVKSKEFYVQNSKIQQVSYSG
jgi:hypothetical protein